MAASADHRHVDASWNNIADIHFFSFLQRVWFDDDNDDDE